MDQIDKVESLLFKISQAILHLGKGWVNF